MSVRNTHAAHHPDAEPVPEATWPEPRQLRLTRVIKTLWRGQPGTLKLARRHGARLVCVRYRQDPLGLHRYTTIELIVEHGPAAGRHFDNKTFAVKIDYQEEALRHAARQHGAQWDPRTQTWHIQGWALRRLNLESRVRKPPKPGHR